ncbi:GNAT family N-acetyltransferase [Fusobacterium nucleatum]|uniref:Acetyltransferase n=2 Tax=Fusobacterium nucleatum subsp. nucleatum TaxID=76856 RepID=Q8R6C6_FUSNN|nr:GNAT family N-acetyltransferase [Fusobacterium nucleatum]AAL94269.1 Acetyltransferase [Fusobacterium nucleatum subsp. nucleatum ATCC 25586]ALF23280.1 acetyltransferase [Fusobacterium nucleatum subsp. nucleatum ChDC F316]ALF26343.1 acetyltransferase [Fusobacterium nucleatum subsp. nucleatum]ASG25704.1 N-acetyltransferase [Fusobacterium nucleatum subsp. nucleatum]AVQ14370.1 N-acetyltransferase [Fusobacterium nucleatum subsp. nucleatum ATCC 25586]
MSKFKIRNMKEDDIEIIYKNLHFDFVNKYFKNRKQQQKIHKNHNEWYKTHISSFDYSIYIFEDEENNFVALTSYEILANVAKVNIYLNKDYRNKKYSQEILSESINKFLIDYKNIKYLQAYILEENIASKKIFENLGFIYNNEKEICNDGLEYLVYKRI